MLTEISMYNNCVKNCQCDTVDSRFFKMQKVCFPDKKIAVKCKTQSRFFVGAGNTGKE